MPKQLGRKWKDIAEAAAREQAALVSLQTVSAAELPGVVAELQAARNDKANAREAPEAEFICAWHRDPGKNRDGVFEGRERIVFEVTGVWKYNTEGEPVFEQVDRFNPMYLVACPNCGESLGLINHLME